MVSTRGRARGLLAKVEVGSERPLPTSTPVGVGVGVGVGVNIVDSVEAGDGAVADAVIGTKSDASSRYFAGGRMVRMGRVDMGEGVYEVVKVNKSAFYQARHGEFANPWESPWNNGV